LKIIYAIESISAIVAKEEYHKDTPGPSGPGVNEAKTPKKMLKISSNIC